VLALGGIGDGCAVLNQPDDDIAGSSRHSGGILDGLVGRRHATPTVLYLAGLLDAEPVDRVAVLAGVQGVLL
jgi:hypothetical protein